MDFLGLLHILFSILESAQRFPNVTDHSKNQIPTLSLSSLYFSFLFHGSLCLFFCLLWTAAYFRISFSGALRDKMRCFFFFYPMFPVINFLHKPISQHHLHFDSLCYCWLKIFPRFTWGLSFTAQLYQQLISKYPRILWLREEPIFDGVTTVRLTLCAQSFQHHHTQSVEGQMTCQTHLKSVLQAR